MLSWLFEKIFLAIIAAYRWTLSPLIGRQCRYQPTCSIYGREAIKEWGPWRGGWMALRRICRCHPWHAAGFDPVPPKPGKQEHTKPQNDTKTVII